MTYNKERYRKYYLANKDNYLENNKRQIEKRRNFVRELKTSTGCKICGENRWWVLDFHHRNKSDKLANVKRLMYKGSMKKLKEEIQKCDILCVNCHKDLHHKQST